MNSFSVEPIYDSVVVASLVSLLALGVLVLVTPPTKNINHRRALIALRVIASGVLVLALFRPGWIHSDSRVAEATLVVAVDASRSMSLPDDEKVSRWTHQAEAWRKLADGLSSLDDSMSVQLLTYKETTTPVSSVTATALDAQSPDGEVTDLAGAVSSAIASAQGQPLAGVIVMGDGTQTAPIEGVDAQRSAQTLRAWGVPLWTVPIGPSGGSESNRDVGIDALPESFNLFSKNEFEVIFQVQLRGLVGTDIPIQLNWIDESGKSVVAAERRVVAQKASDLIGMSIPVIAPEAGVYRLNVTAEVQSGELVTTNNLQTAFVNVREGGGRILYLEGASRLEQTYLRRALRRFPDLDLTYQWIPSDTSSRWPIAMRDWFRKGRFDIYIIGDLDADAIGREQLQELAETISDGAGLVMLGGYHNFDAGGYATSPLADVLPIKMDPLRRMDIRSDTKSSDVKRQISGPITIKRTRDHPITDLGGADVAETWRSLPELLGANRFLGPRVAPGTQVLLETTTEEPLLVVGEYGRGRTAALAIDSTWQWWRSGENEVYRRFWRQLALWLLSREESPSERLTLELDSRRFAVQTSTKFRARLTLADPSNRPNLLAKIIDESGAETDVTETAMQTDARELLFSGNLPELTPGYYRLKVSPIDPSSKIESEMLAFQVTDASPEMAMPMADPAYLTQLAEITSEHGGGAFRYDQMGELLKRIAVRRHRSEAPVVEKTTLGDDPVSGWLLFVLFAGTLSVEWFLRRQWGL